MNSLISSYSLLDTISSGPKGAVIRAEQRDSNDIFVIKCQNIEYSEKHHHNHSSDNEQNQSNPSPLLVAKHSALKKEANVYKSVTGAPGFPAFKQFFSDGTAEHLVLELLGPNLQTLMEKGSSQSHPTIPYLSLKSVLQIADQGLLKIEYLHKKGYVHGNLTPTNFVIGLGHNSNLLYLLDMSHSIRYKHKETGELIPFSDKSHNQGDPAFSSINSQKDWRLSRRDDIESLGYLLVYLLTGSLPWLRYTSPKDILYCKMNTLVKHLCDGLPSEFAQFINSARCLEFTDEPDYSGYRDLFRDLFINQGFSFDYIYDWTPQMEPSNQTISYIYYNDANSKTISLLSHPKPMLVKTTSEIPGSKISKPKTISPNLLANAAALSHQQACSSMLNAYVHHAKRHSAHSITPAIGQIGSDNKNNEEVNTSNENNNPSLISKISPSPSTPTTLPKSSGLTPDLLLDQSSKRRGSHTPSSKMSEGEFPHQIHQKDLVNNIPDKKSSQAKKQSKKRRLLIHPS